jgi:MFS family permease
MSISEKPQSEQVQAPSHLSSSVIGLGFVSLFMDLSSEMIHSLLPVFLVSVLGVNAVSVGFIEGIAEATTSVTKVFSGVISDWIGKRKPLILLGYGLAAVTKPLFPVAFNIPTVLVARLVDRFGKGIRGAPRDALIADLTPQALRGAAYGMRQAMDTVGAFLGPALAILLMAKSGDNFRFVFWLAVVPAFVAVAIILLGVNEPEVIRAPVSRKIPIRRADLARLDRAYWWVVGVASVLTLARFSEAFLLLRAQTAGVAAAFVPAVLMVMNIIYAASAYPFGRLADKVSRKSLLAIGIVLLIAADVFLAFGENVYPVFIGAALWELHMGATQGLLSTFVASTCPENLRGTAFGIFNLLGGVALLTASVLAGLLWTRIGPTATFITGAGLASLALIGFLARYKRQH